MYCGTKYLKVFTKSRPTNSAIDLVPNLLNKESYKHYLGGKTYTPGCRTSGKADVDLLQIGKIRTQKEAIDLIVSVNSGE